MYRIGKSIKKKVDKWLPGLWGRGEWRVFLIVTGFPFEVMKCSGIRKQWWLHNF